MRTYIMVVGSCNCDCDCGQKSDIVEYAQFYHKMVGGRIGGELVKIPETESESVCFLESIGFLVRAF